jgi:hypothetical protein
VLLHQAAQRRAIAPVVIFLQAKRLVMADMEKIDNVIADSRVDLLPQIEVMRIKRIVEVEHPGLDRAEVAHGAPLGSRRLVIAIFHGEEGIKARRGVATGQGAGDHSMRRKWRKTLPFLVAICLGTLAAALIAGVALLTAHS